MSSVESTRLKSGDVGITQNIATLKPNKERLVLRIVNSSDHKVKFNIKSSSPSQNIRIAPRTGIIDGRSYVYIVVESPDFSSPNLTERHLALHYYRRDPSKVKRYTRGVVPIVITGVKKLQRLVKADLNASYCFALLSIRSILLFALILYNIVLIRIKLKD